MNPYGSYRALLRNAVSALSAALEIYNKPRIEYRDECTVILLVNAWELLLKALLSKNHVRIFCRKRIGQPYRTYSLSDALNKATPYFPAVVDFSATAKNIELLVDYRDNAIHFYNEPGFSVIVYSLAQAAITNFRDLAKTAFAVDISEAVNLCLVPLALATPVDAAQFLKHSGTDGSVAPSVRQFTARLRELVIELEGDNRDTGRLLTIVKPFLVSTKKIAHADFTVGVQSGVAAGPPVLVHHRIDPNRTHPYRQTDIVTRKGDVGGLGIEIGTTPLTQYPFQAIGYFLKAKEEPQFCWADTTGAVTRYSQAYVDRIKSLTPDELATALRAYKRRVRQ